MTARDLYRDLDHRWDAQADWPSDRPPDRRIRPTNTQSQTARPIDQRDRASRAIVWNVFCLIGGRRRFIGTVTGKSRETAKVAADRKYQARNMQLLGLEVELS